MSAIHFAINIKHLNAVKQHLRRQEFPTPVIQPTDWNDWDRKRQHHQADPFTRHLTIYGSNPELVIAALRKSQISKLLVPTSSGHVIIVTSSSDWKVIESVTSVSA